MNDLRAVRLSTCLLSIVVATVVHVVLAPIFGRHSEFITYFMAVVYCAWIGGFGAGLLATVLAIAAAAVFVDSAGFRFSFANFNDDLSMLLFLFEGAAIAALGQAQISARLRAEKSAAKSRASEADALRSLEVLAASELRKSGVIRDALDCIIVIDGAGLVTEFNPAAESTFGYSRRDVVGKPIADLIIPPSLRSAHHEGFARYLATGVGPIIGQRTELTAMRQDGVELPIELAIVQSGSAESLEFTAYIRDISERKRSEQELKEAGARQWLLVRDILFSVTQGRLILCASPSDLPRLLEPAGAPLELSMVTGTAELRALAKTTARRIGVSDERIIDLVTACSEAAMNAIVHVGAGVGSVFADSENGVIQIRVVDSGSGISIENLPLATLRKGYTTAGTFGHGMKMMLETCDRVCLLTGGAGTTVILEMDRTPAMTAADLGPV